MEGLIVVEKRENGVHRRKVRGHPVQITPKYEFSIVKRSNRHIRSYGSVIFTRNYECRRSGFGICNENLVIPYDPRAVYGRRSIAERLNSRIDPHSMTLL